MKDKANSSPLKNLRQKAEEILLKKVINIGSSPTDIEILKLIHELDVQKIELEMQNEELILANKNAEYNADKYAYLYDFAPSGFFTLSKEGEIMELNFRGATLLGKERSLLINKRFAIFVKDEERTKFNLFLEEIYKNKTKQSCELILSIVPNTNTYIYLSGIINDDGEQCLITSLDISKRKNAEETLKISEEKYHNLFDTNRDSITIFRLDSDNNPGNFIEVNPATTTLFGYTKKELLTLNVSDIELVSEKKRKDRINILLAKGRLDFESVIKNKRGKLRNVEIETVLINFLNKPAVMNITRDITERKQSEKNVQKAQENLNTILEAIPDLLFEVDLEGRIYHYQAHREDLLALPPSEFMGKLFHEVLPINVVNVCIDALQEANNKGWSTGKQYELDLPLGKHWFELSISAIKGSDDNNKHFILLARDITSRKKAEEALQKSQEKLMGVFELANSGIMLTDANGKYLLFNNWCVEAFGYTREEMNKLNIKDITHPEDIEKSNLCLQEIFSGKTNRFQIEKRFIRKDKSFFWAEVSVSAIKNKKNKTVNIIGIITDITERRINEEKLKQSEARLIAAQAVAKIGSWETDLTFTDIIWSEENNKIFGIDTKVTKISLKEFLAMVHPEDKNLLETTFAHSIKTKKTNSLEHRIITREGVEKIVEQRWEILSNEEGQPYKAVGTCQDITERKQIEKKLIENEYRLQTILSTEPECVKIVDAQGLLISMNPAGLKILEADSQDYLIHKPVLEVIAPEYHKSFTEMHNKVLKGDSLKMEFEVISLKGNRRWVETSAVPFQDNGKIVQLSITRDITERKLAEKQLRESEEKYRGLVENSPDGIVIYINNKIAFVNDEALRIFKAKNRDEIIGKSVFQYVHPDSKKRIIQRMKDVILLNNSSKIVEEKFISLDGETIYTELKAIPTIYEHQNAVQVIIHDITERKHTQVKIRQLSQAVEQSPVAIVITNTDGIIEYVNPKFIETTGYDLDEIIGKNSRLLKSGYTTENEYKQLWETLTSGNEWFGEFHNKKKDGTLYWESASISPILNSKGKITHYIAIKEDITERKHIEQQLIKAKEKAEESDRLKLAFLANMSHEIRTPMNGILGFTELLKEKGLPSDIQQEYIKIIEKSGKRMLNIINDIINISKVESGQIEINFSETNVNEQIEYLHTFFKPEATQKNIQFSITKELSPKDNIIKSDPEKIYAILTNLVKNALKFTNKGSIEFGCVKKGRNLEFFIKDTGLGISNSHKKLIFERFRQANESISRSHEGSGLGLAISKAYVEILGGKIWVESDEGIGSTFYFTIPFNTEFEPKEKIVAKKVDSEIKNLNNVNDLKVLIVEDDAISKLLITIAVKPYSKEILKVSSGLEAIEACRNNPDIDLVMMDINMPEMSGYETTKQIRKFNKDIVIIAQTANGMQSDREKTIAAGCSDYISKPVNIKTLSELIQKYFEK